MTGICARAALVEERLWDGTITNEERADLADHARTCVSCREILEGVFASKEALSIMETTIPSVDAAWRDVEGRIDEAPKRTSWGTYGAMVACLGAIVIGSFVALGGPVRNMFARSASSQTLGQGQAALSSTIYSGDYPTAIASTTDAEAIPVERRVERGATLSIEVADARSVHKALTDRVLAAGGSVLSSNVGQSTAEAPATASLSIRIPEGAFDGFVNELRAMGRVLSEEVRNEDRTEAYRDLAARLRDQEAIEKALRERLAQGAGSTEEVRRIGSELGAARAERESLETNRRAVASRTDFSRIEIRLREPEGNRRGISAYWGDFAGPFGSSASLALKFASWGLSVMLVGTGALLPWALLAGLLVRLGAFFRRVRVS